MAQVRIAVCPSVLPLSFEPLAYHFSRLCAWGGFMDVCNYPYFDFFLRDNILCASHPISSMLALLALIASPWV